MTTDIAVQPVNQEPKNMLQIIDRALQTPGFDIVALKELLALKERYDANEAKKAYNVAMTAFKDEGVRVVKDKLNKQYDSKYVSLENLVETVTPYLSKHNLTADWEIDQTNGIKITLVVTHVQGHSERRAAMTVPPDTSGAKNAIQQIKSAITYAKVCTYESGLGLASVVGSLSDDGNASGDPDPLNDEIVVQRLDAIKESRDDAELKKFYLIAIKEAQEVKDKNAVDCYTKAKNQRWRELHAKGKP